MRRARGGSRYLTRLPQDCEVQSSTASERYLLMLGFCASTGSILKYYIVNSYCKMILTTQFIAEEKRGSPAFYPTENKNPKLNPFTHKRC